MTQGKAQNRAALSMAACAVLWSTAGIFIKLIPWNPLVISGWRSLFAAGVMALYIRRAGLKFRVNRSSVLSGISLAGTLLAFVCANKLTTAANAIVLQYTSPVFILIFSAIFLKQKLRRADIAVVAASVAGISLFFFDGLSDGGLLGNCIAIFAGICMAVTCLVAGGADPDSRMSGILLGQLAAAAVGVPLTAAFPSPASAPAVLSIFALGVLQLGVPYVLYGLALKDCPPLACSLIGMLEPLLNPVWVFLFSGEVPGPRALLGGAVVIVSVTGWCVLRDRHPVRDGLRSRMRKIHSRAPRDGKA